MIKKADWFRIRILGDWGRGVSKHRSEVEGQLDLKEES